MEKNDEGSTERAMGGIWEKLPINHGKRGVRPKGLGTEQASREKKYNGKKPIFTGPPHNGPRQLPGQTALGSHGGGVVPLKDKAVNGSTGRESSPDEAPAGN